MIHVLLILGVLLAAAPASGYEGPTTLAGLAERAAHASRLHRKLVERFGSSLGLLEPLRLDPRRLSPPQAQALEERLLVLSESEGYGPEALPGPESPPLRRQSAVGWLMAGAVLETVPAARIQHHFLDLSRRGLHRPPGQSAAAAALRSLAEGLSSFRELVTGSAFDGSGRPATEWLLAQDNDLGLPAFFLAYERAVLAEAPEERETALVQALLAAGGVLGLLGQMADPAHVRNDLPALLSEGGPYGRHVAARLGRAGVPEPRRALPGDTPRHLIDLFQDLARRTARRYFSPGTLPGTGAPLPDGAAALLSPDALRTRGAAVTEVPPGWPTKDSGYLGTQEVPHLAAWARVRLGDRSLLRWSLDERCHEDYARTLLPEAGRRQAAALDHVLRGDLARAPAVDGERDLTPKVLGVALQGGTVTAAVEDAAGRRRRIGQVAVDAVAPGEALPLPALGEGALRGARRLVLLYKGQDDAGEPLLLSTQIDIPDAPSPEKKGSP